MTNEELLEVVRKIVFVDKDGGLSSRDFNKIFPNMNKAMVLDLPPYEIYMRVKEYEDSNKIEVGDIVRDFRDFTKYLVLDDAVGMNGNDMVYLFSENGCVELLNKKCLVKLKPTNYVDEWVRKLQNYEPLN